MDCPKCEFSMQTVRYQSVEVDRCASCKGIWFELGELDELLALRGSEEIDIGDSSSGKEYNRTDRIDCPICRSQMVRMVDRDQPHIWFEKCSGCSGIFLDAGEFRDLKHDTWIDFLKDLIAKPRT